MGTQHPTELPLRASMDNDVRERLIKCFSVVFPELTEKEILRIALNGPGNWDSLSWVTLLAVIEEEFGINLDVGGLENRPAFGAVLEQIREAGGGVSSEPQASVGNE